MDPPALRMDEFLDLELHRDGFGLVPGHDDSDPGLALWIPARDGKGDETRTCSCRAAKRRMCAHQRRLLMLGRRFDEELPGFATRRFEASIWYRLAEHLFRGEPAPLSAVAVAAVRGDGHRSLRVTGDDGMELARYLSNGGDTARFLARLGRAPKDRNDRAAILDRLRLCQLSETQRFLAARGAETIGQSFEKSFWHRLAWHCFRDLGNTGTFRPGVDEASGNFSVTHRLADDTETVRIVVPREQVRAVLEMLAEAFPGEPGLAVFPIPLRTLFHVAATTELDAVEVRPVLEALQAGGERAYLDGAELERFRYGSLVWVKELGILAELERPEKDRRFAAPARVTLRRHQIPGFLESVGEEAVIGDGEIVGLRVHHDWNALEIYSQGEQDGAVRVKIGCEFEGAIVPLGELLDARRRGAPYFDTASGWVKLDSPALARIEATFSRSPTARLEGETASLSAADLFRLGASGVGAVRVGGDPACSARLRRLLALRPARPWRPLAGFTSELRDYQVRGVEWLRFLAENGLSGLLCDDMGLGKTHQAMALMAWLRQDGVADPFLVVCPTTVIGHWRDKLARHAPGLRAVVHHGAGRSFDEALAGADVVVTSYGILRNDIDLFASRRFAGAVFDEIQQAKNRETLAHEALRRIDAGIRVGLTGTPVENQVGDLEALLDLALPGYIAAAGRAPSRKVDPSPADLEHLRRLATPFVLRRLKSSVLDELPEKIEDLRRATPSSDQLRLYREALARRGASLTRELADGAKPVPYLHIFALLDHLKQICDHPALALGTPERFTQYESGKWDVFQEILQESLDGGEKVVVFTQYLGMIAIVEKLLGSLGIGYAKLTGRTRDRSGAIARFNEDPSCRVFVGSLKAGGTGIDLVGGSVVIHYDRWWNAAREDQATDRVHRIGQRRVVQVFKLVTEGTLEERIDEIIARKRDLLDQVVAPDDPGALKSFTRDELLALLAPPPKASE